MALLFSMCVSGRCACECVLAFVLAFITKYYGMSFKLIDWWDDCVCIFGGGRNTNRSMTQDYSAIYFVKQPIRAVQPQSVVSFTPPH